MDATSQEQHSSPDHSLQANARKDLYRAAIGAMNRDYYVTRFLRFDAARRAGVSWNWSAGLFTFCWLLYRKMWGAAALYFALPYVLMAMLMFGLSILGPHDNALAVGMFEIIYFFASLLIPAMFANAWYYRHCSRLISRTAKTAKDNQISDLAAKGGTSRAALALVFLSIFSAGGLSAIAIPAYQDHVTRALVTQAAKEGREAAKSVADYYMTNHKVPATLQETGFVAKPSDAVSAYAIDQNGIVSITIANGAARNHRLLLVPVLDDAGTIHWRCLSREIPGRQLPIQCKA